MIKSMTGFGSAEISAGSAKGYVELKSVNHRYFDVGYFLPIGFSSAEGNIQKVLHAQLKRGRVNVYLKLLKKEAATVKFNKDIVKAYLKNGKDLQKSLGLKGELSLGEIVRLPGVVEMQESELNPKQLLPAIEKAVKRAMTSLAAMRKKEGLSIVADVKKQLSRMSLEIKKIQIRGRKILKEKKKKLSAEEFTAYQKSIDVNEELSRLLHHTKEFGFLLKSNVSVGKKLDFIAQEMQREANTVGSKLQDKIVSSAAISLKSQIEKLREQAQNVE